MGVIEFFYISFISFFFLTIFTFLNVILSPLEHGIACHFSDFLLLLPFNRRTVKADLGSFVRPMAALATEWHLAIPLWGEDDWAAEGGAAPLSNALDAVVVVK